MRPWMLSAILSFSLLFIGCDEDQTAAPDCCVSDLEAAVDAWQDSEAGGDIAVDVSLPDGKPPDGGGDEAGMDQGGGDASSDSSGGDAGNPWGPYVEARGLMHMHSPYSHDACDGKGLINGKPNATCLKELRAALCKNRFDFTFLTDHPSNMKSYSIKEDLLHDAAAGDKLWLYGGVPIANLVTCVGGHQLLLSVGYESKHMMPLGLHKIPTKSTDYGGITDSDAIASVQAQVKALKAYGAVVAMVHSEEKDISAKTIVNGGFDAMEWYNIHANFAELIGADTLSFDLKNLAKLGTIVQKLITLSPFLSTGSGAPHPDLIYMVFLDVVPKAGFTKWREAQSTRLVTGILGSDIHRNVSVDASVCAGTLKPLCLGALGLVEVTLGIKIPAVVKTLLSSGGSIVLGDKDRVDSYERLGRWMENRLLVKKKGDQLELQDALRKGRAYGLFSVFGGPTGFGYTGQQGSATLQMGESAKGPVTLTVKVPVRPTVIAAGFAPFTAAEALKAKVRVDLLHTGSKGTTIVQATSGLGSTLTYKTSTPGAYHAELFIKPLHQEKALGASKALASKEYLWAITNPIFVK